jgi:RNA polymerase sigma-70 factor (ECF subfamily)
MVKEPAAAEDLFQQTWLKVVTHLHSYDARRDFEPWLFTIARNLAVDHLRRRSAQSLDEPTPSGEPRVEKLAATGPGAFEALLQRERRSYLAERMEELPAIYREALTLRFEEEMTFEEMAGVLATPISTVKSRVQRGLKALRKNVLEGKRNR